MFPFRKSSEKFKKNMQDVKILQLWRVSVAVIVFYVV